MRKFVVAALAAVALSGCVSSIEGAYDDHARTECEREVDAGSQRQQCYDRVDDYRREHR